MIRKLCVLLMGLFALQTMVKADDERLITVDQLPKLAQNFIVLYFPDHKISMVKEEEDFFNVEYDVIFTDGCKVEFLKNGEWKKIECRVRPVPYSVVPGSVRTFIEQKHPDTQIMKIEKERGGLEIELNNKIELVFGKDLQFKRYED